ncbi:cilia- and flagella-associated protein 69 [Lingula anatina]|uniref:Cilia- and flagella-associated protein 69 n=1 Tax=Lingula anatina TaxID=7574 RepID=A0A1S3JLC2_LINAN|nr:cilia- and flagella-associated protein 69 [Lingula anatina]|eukprot:XP_013410709.1 cilia- and flagella-associated protein 69 [Lingula anatina]
MATETQFAPRVSSQNPTQTLTTSKPRIPIVSHTITDDDLGILQGAKLQPMNLTRVAKLMTDPHSSMLYDRHIHALRKLPKHYKQGFLMKDLVLVVKILNVCADRLEEQPMYTEPMCSILDICRLPFLKEKTSDETSYERIAIESVSQLGYLMRVPSNDIRKKICAALISFYCETPPPQVVQKHKANSLSYNQRIVESSDLSETLVKSLALLENDLDVRLEVLKVLQQFSKRSAKNCDQMLCADAASRLCCRLMDPDPSGELLFRSVDVLWNLLEYGQKENAIEQINDMTCISQLRDAFIQQLTQGYSHYDRQLRNDLLIIASLIAQVCPQAPFVETGFVRQLTLFATFQEVKSHSALVRHLKLMTSHEDFELKKLLINILTVLSKDPCVVPLLSEGRLLLALFSYVRPNENTSLPRDWTPAQFEELQLCAMASLATLVPFMVEDYMMCQGSTRLLLLMEWCTGEKGKFNGYGNAFHGAGGRGNKRAQMRHCLRLMRSAVSTGREVVLQDLVDQGAISEINTILRGYTENDSSTEDAIDVEMQCDMLYILSTLCDGDMHRKELFSHEGVDIVCKYLKTNPVKLSSGLGHHKLVLATVDCIWCAIVGCYVTEDYFLEKEGVFLLIDLLEVCPTNMHNLILGCLLDLTENPKAIPHINAWRGKDDMSAAHLFCDIWRSEEREMGVQRDQQGAIADTSLPLTGQLQANQGVIPLPASCPSQAIVDVSENMRAKLYALFCKIGFMHLPGLTVEDYVTLAIIEKYMDFKLGEVWSEVITELDAEGIRPVTPDQEAIETISRAIVDRADSVVGTQKDMLLSQQHQSLMEEQEHYAEIRENHRQKEKAINDFADFVARTSNYSLLKAARERQELSVDASRVQNRYQDAETFHELDLANLNTTAFSGRQIMIDSTPVELTGGPLAKYDSKKGTLKSRTFQMA